MYNFLQENYAKTPAVHVYGPQGIGKSHSLYQIVCQLKSDSTNRVIYIPDCAGWAYRSGLELEFLLEVISRRYFDNV